MNLSASVSAHDGLRNSFINILAFVMQNENSCDSRLICLSKWGTELGYQEEELQKLMFKPSSLVYKAPVSNIDALSQVYDLVCMVYMDGIVEDIELDLVSIYASGVGLEAHVVNNLLKALVAAQLDGIPNEAIRSDIKVHPEVSKYCLLLLWNFCGKPYV